MEGHPRVTGRREFGTAKEAHENRKPYDIRLKLSEQGEFDVPAEDIVRYLSSLKPTSTIPSSADLRKLMAIPEKKKKHFRNKEFTVKQAKWTMQDISSMLTTFEPPAYDILAEARESLTDKNGKLTVESMKELLSLVGLTEEKEPINMEVLAEIIDSDCDGDVSTDDIRHMFAMPFRQPGFARYRRASSMAVKRRGAIQMDFNLKSQLQ